MIIQRCLVYCSESSGANQRAGDICSRGGHQSYSFWETRRSESWASAPRDAAGVPCIALPGTFLCSRGAATGHEGPGSFRATPAQTSLWVSSGADAIPACLGGHLQTLGRALCWLIFHPWNKRLSALLHLAFCSSEWTFHSFTWNWTTTTWLFWNFRSHVFPLLMSKAVDSSKQEVNHCPVSHRGCLDSTCWDSWVTLKLDELGEGVKKHSHWVGGNGIYSWLMGI